MFAPYLVHEFTLGGSGADVAPLKNESIFLSEIFPDSQRFFDYHHFSDNDTFNKVNRRELELGAATMAALIYLIDTHYKTSYTALKTTRIRIQFIQ